MPGNLLNPDNRLLGSSINDLSLYGATTPTNSAPPLSALSATFSEPAPIGDAPAAPSADPALVTAMVQPIEAFERPADNIAAGSASSPFIYQPPGPAEITPAAAPEIGSGSIAPLSPIVQAASQNVADAPNGAAAAQADASVLPTSLVPDAPLHVTAPLIEAIGASTAQALANDQAHLDQSVGAVLASTEAVGSTVTAAVGDVVDTLAALDVTAPLAQTNDLLTGIGGTDPAGGVETLVGMVAAADHFDLSHAVAELPEASPLVDMLAIDDADVPPLGAVDLPVLDSDDHHSLLGL